MEHQQIQPPSVQPGTHSEFNWAIYADATLAGLSALIPVPYVDSALEARFRRRMVHSIARQRNRTLHPAALHALQEDPVSSIVKDVLRLPINLSIGLVRRFSRKVLYFLSVKRAVDLLTFYWRRAYLLDYMVRQGHLSSEATAPAAVAALNTVLAQSGSGPFRWLAQQVVAGTPHVAGLLWEALPGGKKPDQSLLLNLRTLLAEKWPDASDYLRSLARRYDEQMANLRSAARQSQMTAHTLPLVSRVQEG